MIYIIYGDQKFLVNRTLKKVEKGYNDIQKFNYLEDSYDDILKSISSFSLFSDKKMVEIFNFKPLLMSDTELKKDKKVEQIIDSIIKCDHIDIYLIIYEASLVNNELYEYVEKNGKFIQNLSLSKNDWKIYASKKFEKVGVKISPDALEELISRCENDLNRFDIEFNKVTSYSYDLKMEDIKMLVPEPLEENIFNMVNDLLDFKKDKCIEKYRKLLYSNDPVRMISLFATNFRFYSQCYFLNIIDKKNINEIAKILKCNPKRAEISIKKIKSIGINRINRALENLFDIDYKIKGGVIEKNIAFELFIDNF